MLFNKSQLVYVYFFIKCIYIYLGWVTWKGIVTRFVPIGLCLIAVMQWRAYRKHVGKHTAKQWEVNCYCALPLRAVSRCWGWVAGNNNPMKQVVL